jgi:hypothetical protein
VIGRCSEVSDGLFYVREAGYLSLLETESAPTWEQETPREGSRLRTRDVAKSFASRLLFS